MARIRTIKPEFWDDEKVGTLSFMERLLFIGMWTFADDEGIIKANASYLKSHIFPYDESLKTDAIEKSLQRFESLNMVYRYSINSQAYAWIVKFRVYQRIDKPQKSTNPSPSTQNGKYASAVHARDGYVCHLCGSECSPFQIIGKETDPRVASLDHIIPQSKGGHNYPSNLRTACISCNKSRGNKDLEEFLKEIGRFQEYSENNPGTFNDGMERNGKERKGKEGKDIGADSSKRLFLEDVRLTEAEFQKLVAKHGREPTDRAIEILNNYKKAKGKKYSSDYHAILNWAMEKAKQGGNGNGAYQRLDKFGKPVPRQKWEDEADRINADYYRRKAQDAPDGKAGKDAG